MNQNRGLWRGKRIDSSVWAEGYYLYLSECDLHIIVSLDGQYNRVDLETLGECTGKPDIKGKPIFEGDIVRAYKYGEEKFVNSISFKNGCFWFGSWSFIEFLDKFRGYEVIGNIYDNPELLKGGENNG